MPTDLRTRLASYAVAISDRRILLAHIAAGYPLEDHWTLPGGGLDWGEHPDEALVREVHEETGLSLDSYALAGVDSQALGPLAGRPTVHAVRFIYHCTTSGEPNVMEENGSVDAAAWIALDDLGEMKTVTIIERALEITKNA